MSKEFANKKVKRNKKPLQNIIYFFTPITKNNIRCNWQYEKQYIKQSDAINYGGIVSREFVKKVLSKNQWNDFCQGETKFIVQRRIDGKKI